MKRSYLTLVLISIVLPFFAFMGLTSPKTVVSFPVSFSFGADSKIEEFEVQALHGYVQVEVVVDDGSSLWNAQILRGDEVVWSYSTHQSGQTVYKSEWIELSRGNYKFTYATAGLGSLDARIRVVTKGGFW